MAGIENAREVRDLVLGYVKKFNRGSGLGDLDDVEHTGARSESVWTAGSHVIAALRDVRDEAARLRSCLNR
jgi:hypothetical protein